MQECGRWSNPGELQYGDYIDKNVVGVICHRFPLAMYLSHTSLWDMECTFGINMQYLFWVRTQQDSHATFFNAIHFLWFGTPQEMSSSELCGHNTLSLEELLALDIIIIIIIIFI